MSVSKDQARELAKTFLDMAYALSRYRFDNWGKLTANERRSIADVEWTLHNHSDDFSDTAVGLALNDVESELRAIRKATAKAKRVITTMATVSDVLTVSAGLIVLGGAIASQNPGAIATATADLLKTSKTLFEANT